MGLTTHIVNIGTQQEIESLHTKSWLLHSESMKAQNDSKQTPLERQVRACLLYTSHSTSLAMMGHSGSERFALTTIVQKIIRRAAKIPFMTN